MAFQVSRTAAAISSLEAKFANDVIVLTETQVQALEKKKLDDEAWGEIETAHPGYLGSQDTFYVGERSLWVMITDPWYNSRSGKWPLRTTNALPSSVCSSEYRLMNSAARPPPRSGSTAELLI